MEEIVNKTLEYVKTKLENDSSGHDFWHIYRVWKNAINIAKDEKVDILVIELAAILHDLGDYKLNNGVELGSKPAREWLEKNNIDEKIIIDISHIIDNMSFSKMDDAKELSFEGKIVQDADRLDGIGAIGIARCFAYGGKTGSIIFNPNIEPNLNLSKEEYKKNGRPSLNHFHEKLLLLKDKMNTESGKKIAQERHNYLENFIKQFHEEWEGNK